jgi:hypothetical protein
MLDLSDENLSLAIYCANKVRVLESKEYFGHFRGRLRNSGARRGSIQFISLSKLI